MSDLAALRRYVAELEARMWPEPIFGDDAAPSSTLAEQVEDENVEAWLEDRALEMDPDYRD